MDVDVLDYDRGVKVVETSELAGRLPGRDNVAREWENHPAVEHVVQQICLLKWLDFEVYYELEMVTEEF